MFWIGLNTGATKYKSYSSNTDLHSTSVFGKNFEINGEIYNAEVGNLESYSDFKDTEDNPITFNFDYDITSVKLYAKTNQNTKGGQLISGATISEDKRQVIISSGVTSSNLFVLVLINVSVGYSYSEDLINCYSDFEGSSITEGTHKITLYAEEDYIFKNPPTIEIGSNKHNFEISSDSTKATIEININGNVKIKGVAEDSETYYSITENLEGVNSNNSSSSIVEDTEKTITYNISNPSYRINKLVSNVGTVKISEDRKSGTVTFKATKNIEITCIAEDKYIVEITGSFNNCYSNYENGEVYSTDKPIKIFANEGFTFKDSFTLKVDYSTRRFSNESSTELRFEPNRNIGGIIYLDDDYKAVKEIEELSSFTNLYYPTNSELAELSKKRFAGVDGVEDLGSFITNLFILPFDLPSKLIGDRSNIILGNVNTRVETTLINNYTYSMNLGNIEVIEKYNNVYDYINTDYILHLPFFNKIYLNSEYVVNQVISLELIIDLYSGVGTLNIYSSFTDEIIDSRKETIVTMIPFIQSSSNNVIGSISRVSSFINQAFIEVVRNRPYNVDSIFGGNTIEYGRIGDFEDFVKCDNVILNTKASNNEKSLIKNLLQEGVLI